MFCFKFNYLSQEPVFSGKIYFTFFHFIFSKKKRKRGGPEGGPERSPDGCPEWGPKGGPVRGPDWGGGGGGPRFVPTHK